MNRLAVYCGSATPTDPRYIEVRRATSAEPSPNAASGLSTAAAGSG